VDVTNRPKVSLAPLSRDHHEALVIARQLRRADADSAPQARGRFLGYWRCRGERHFELEEELLLPCYAAHGNARHPLVMRVLADHVVIRSRAAWLVADPLAPYEQMHELGRRLAAHVRMEERELFPLIEDAVPGRELAAMVGAFEAADA
jgi:Hemerythrin HHE cation binding domain